MYVQSESQDQIRLQWSSGKSAIMNILVVHAMIILLTYGQPRGEQVTVGLNFEVLVFLQLIVFTAVFTLIFGSETEIILLLILLLCFMLG